MPAPSCCRSAAGSALMSAGEGLHVPLATRMRPRNMGELAGQEHLLAPGRILHGIQRGQPLHSMVLWGPPGSGKTSIARLLATSASHFFAQISAVQSSVKEIRQIADQARSRLSADQQATVLFVDEAHRFNKAQQDCFLPYVEEGLLVFIGATTENPSFELNGALLSRSRVYRLRPLSPEALLTRLQAALEDSERGLGKLQLQCEPEFLETLARAAEGDARRALNLLETGADLAGADRRLGTVQLRELLQSSWQRFDKKGDDFHDQISALHKAVRGSSPDAALYWLSRMLQGGADPLYLARRIVRMASEDIGNADPRALRLALDAWEVQERLGEPEGPLALGQAILYLACAPKSNAAYQAFKAATRDALRYPAEEVPFHLRNAPTKLMKEQGHGVDYRYPHDETHGYAAGESYLPEKLHDHRYYHPVNRGLEDRIQNRLNELRKLDAASSRQRRQARNANPSPKA